MAQMQRTRQEVPSQLTWDLSTLYSSDSTWESELPSIDGLLEKVLLLKGKLGTSADHLAKMFQSSDDLNRKISKLYVYAHLKSDEDTANTKYMGMLDRISTKAVQSSAALAWVDPEILEIPASTLNEFRKQPALKPFQRALDQLLRQKPYTLTEKEERLLSLASEPLGSVEKTFSLLSNADLKFPVINDENGQAIQMTHGNYVKFLESKDRPTRKRAFEAMYDTYGAYKNTFSSTLDGQVKQNVFFSQVRNHPSALEASLFQDNVSKTVYDNLIDAVHNHLPLFYRYVALRKKCLKLPKLDMYDQYVSIIPDFDLVIPYTEACDWVLNSVKPLGDEYVDAFARSFKERWIDVLDCKGKRSGAYSSGCYDSNPFILMNYQDNLNSVFTLAHELGHSLHSFFSNKNQPHIYARYKIFVAEVASTTNEALLHHYLVNRLPKNPSKGSKEYNLKAYLLNHLCDGFRGTVFRQTMFAEYEKMIHEKLEAGTPLTPDELSDSYYKLNKTYYGPDVEADPRIAAEWARIPHFYYNFYVYKYATGFAAAQAFCHQIMSGKTANVEAYLGFLKAGSSKDPLDILADAGVDLRTPGPVQSAMKIFEETLNELESMMD